MEKNNMTAVEWLAHQLFETILIDFQAHYAEDLIEQAKQMEKEQMEHSWRGGKWSLELSGEFEQYYNETYNK